MAKTLYEFKADLKDLQKLNSGLAEAKTKLDSLKKGTAEYKGQLDRVNTSMAQMKTQSGNMKGMVHNMKSVNTQGNKMVAIFKSASIAIASAFAFRAIIGSITGVIKSFSDFESRMAAVKAISGATDAEFKELAKSALELGSTTVFTATQVATLQEEFARLGFTTKEILAAQAATLDLAAATGEDLASAAAIAGSSLRAFGLDAEQIVRVTNTMGAAFTNSALNLERFTQSMKFVAPVGKAAGFTIEETTSLLMNLADAGLHGSIAGNGLKNIFIKLGDANSKLRQEIGHSVQGLPQMIEVLRGMKEESFGLTDAVELLDKRSAPAFLALLENIDGLEANLDTLNGAEGVISEMAAIRLDTLEGDFTLLKSATEGLGIAIGEEFSLSMRQAVFELTKFIQGLQEGGGFINGLKMAFKLLKGAIIGVTGKFIIMKALALHKWFMGLRTHIRSASAAMVAMRGSGTAAVAGIFQLKIAMDALKASIVSTGIGALVVLLGTLASEFFFSSKAAGELEMKMDRMLSSFKKEITAVTELNEGSQERHDLLRKLNTAYPELLDNIDLEIASNKQLLEVLELVNETEGLRLAIAEGNDDIAQLDKKAAEDKIRHSKEIAEAEAKITRIREEGQTSWEKFNWMGSAESQIISIQKTIDYEQSWIDAIERRTAKEKESIEESIGFYTSSLDEKINANQSMNDLSTEEAKSYRLELREGNLEELEDFRTKGEEKQLLLIAEAEAELERLQKISEYKDLEADLDKGSAKDKEASLLAMTDFMNTLTTEEQNYVIRYQKSLGKLNISISEFITKVSNMKAIVQEPITPTGPSRSKALQGFKLENTKKQLKVLYDLQNKMIADNQEQEEDAANKSFEFKKEKYKKEENLMRKNLESIEQMKEHDGRKGDKQIRADLKKNKSKYDVLKNMDMEEWNNLMNRKKTNHDDLLDILDKMYAEETEKLETNLDIQLIMHDVHQKEINIIISKHQAIRRQLLQDVSASELSMEDDSIVNFYNKRKKKTELLKKEIQNEKKILRDQWLDGEISRADFDRELEALNAKGKAQELQDKKDGIDAEIQMYKDMYSQIFDAASSVWNNIQAMKMQSLEETHSRELEEMQGKQDRELELYEGNSEAQANINETYEDRKDALEVKKNQKIKHIKRQQFRLDKANSIVMALINGAQAITKVSGDTGLAAIIAAPIMAGFIATQVAAIAAQKFVGAKGGIIPDDKFAEGGMVHGASHANGGVKFATGGRVVELEGGEAVINKKSTSLFQPLLSQINSHNGYGKQFAAGGITPGTNAITNKKSTGINSDELAMKIAGAVNSKQVFVVESDISGAQNSVAVSESNATIF